jgi:hypothetical protein
MTLLEMLSLRLPYYDIIVLDLPPFIIEGLYLLFRFSAIDF